MLSDDPPSKYQSVSIPKSGGYTFKTLSEYGPMGLLHIPHGYAKLIGRLNIKRFSEIDFSYCIDLGAHHGSFSCWIASLGIPTIAIEADAENFKLLEENSKNLKHLTCMHAAVVGNDFFKTNKFSTFYIGNTSTTGTLVPNSTEHSSNLNLQKVANTCLRELTRNIDNTLLKIAVEGSKWLFLDDLIETLRSGAISVLVGEFHSRDFPEHKYEVFSKLNEIGWRYEYEDYSNGTLELVACKETYP